MKKATIHDICDLTGLSSGTVSKYLNGGAIKEKNRILLADAIQKLNYHVDEYARGLITNKTKTVGILVSRLDNLFYSRMIFDIEEQLYRKGYATIIKESSYDIQKEQKSISWFISHRVDALIIFPISDRREDYKLLEEVDVPVIFLDNYVEGVDRDFILTNNEQISYEVTDCVIKKGHRHIAIIVDGNNAYTSNCRLKGFKRAFADNNIGEENAKIYKINQSIDYAYKVGKEILSEKKVTAIFAANYISTVGCVYLLNELNISVPKTISIVGFDDIMITSLYRPKLTIVNQPMAEIAQKTVERLFELLAEPSLKKQVFILKSKLVYGQTIATI